jgi:hypothetical protein
MGWLATAQQSHGVALREASLFPSSDLDLRHDGINPPNAYRQLTQITQGDRSLQPLDQDKMIEIAAWLSTMNPLGNAILEMLVDYIVGEGFSYKASDIVKPVLDDFWNDWVGRWPEKQVDRFRELSRFGEAAWPLFIRRQDGRVRLGYIEPANIKRVRADPYNIEILQWLDQKSRMGDNGFVDAPPPLRIVYKDESEGKPTENRWVVERKAGDDQRPDGVFYAAINGFLNETRGRSDLMASFDWLDLYDSFCFGAAERSLSATDFIWDVELKGMNPTQMKEWVRENPMPTGRSIRVHNENQIWKAVSPQLHAADVSEQARMIRMQAVLPHRIPEGWLFAGSETNRATLGEQAAPTLKYLSRRQRGAKGIMQRLLEFVRDQAILASTLPSNLSPEDERITVEASEVSTVDLSKMALTLKDATAAVMVGEDRDYYTHDEAGGIARRVANEFGTDLPNEVPAKTLPATQIMDQGVPPEAIDALAQSARVSNGARRLRREVVAAGTERNGNGR